ncbi:MlaD family protein [[Mycobacterium] nativiensis]|uniref:MlaD family protein n=1 Tax=[Mycobacterium] nativiensis TaxID=2855503 RepID=A0ABU5Y1Q1_9MYCO|nr:MlaD family protein [Mycolicibacter sp. MYC340]MEB3034048.1 MlaD family protein [Mycolicibacter sp. MYC340]
MLTSCGSLDVNAIPVPGTSYQDGYEITAEFANVLNLPDRTKVVMDGTRVGVVSKVAIAGKRVAVTARIDRDVVVPSNVHLLLQQATVLGDIYLALVRGEEAAPPLGPGSRIPVDQTTSPPQLEDTIANLANFIGSGSIQRAQNTIIGINRVTPRRPEVRRVVSQITTDLEQLADSVDNVDLLIRGLSETASVVANRAATLNFWYSEEGIAGYKRAFLVANYFGRLLPSLGSIYNLGHWLVPVLNSGANAVEAIGDAKRIVEEEYPAYRRFYTDYFLPQDKYPAINITSIVGPDGKELSGDMEQVLRMLGAIP